MRQQCSPLKIASNSAVLQLAEYDDYWDERQEQEGAVSQNTPNSDTNEPAGIQTDESLQYTVINLWIADMGHVFSTQGVV